MAANNNSHPSTTTVSSDDSAASVSGGAVRPRQRLGVTVCEKKIFSIEKTRMGRSLSFFYMLYWKTQ